jgi:hypothetical protein
MTPGAMAPVDEHKKLGCGRTTHSVAANSPDVGKIGARPIPTKSDTDHRRRGVASISLTAGYGLERGIIMIWTSDSAGVLLFTVIGMFVVLSSICIPA